MVLRQALGETQTQLQPPFAGPLQVQATEGPNVVVNRRGRDVTVHTESTKKIPKRRCPPLEEEDEALTDEEEDFEVEDIIEFGMLGRTPKVKYKWAGIDEPDTQW